MWCHLETYIFFLRISDQELEVLESMKVISEVKIFISNLRTQNLKTKINFLTIIISEEILYLLIFL